MQVLHTHWHIPNKPTDKSYMFFWAESATLPAPPKQRGRRTKTAKDHPFCTSPNNLSSLLQTIESVQPWIVNKKSKLNLWLPSSSFGPHPSPQLVHDWDVDNNKPCYLSPWLVSGVWLNLLDTFKLLTALLSNEDLPVHLATGIDLYYWQQALNLVLETLAQQKILPLLVDTGSQIKPYHARWMPVLDAPKDGPRLATLIDTMPPLCRAETNAPDTASPPRLILESFLNSMTDALARQWGTSNGSLRPTHKKEPSDEWLNSLFTANPQIQAESAQLKHLAKSHKHWLRNLHIAGDKTFRVAFRLEAPIQQIKSEHAEDWQLHYMLQARDDLSLLVSADQVWKTKGNILKTLNTRFEHPQERLLAALGYAARLFEPIKESLKTATPTKLALNTHQAFDFLRESAALLENSGFGVLVPPWWNKRGTRLGVRLNLSSGDSTNSADSTPQGFMSFDNLVRYKWQLSLGGTALSRDEFEALVALKSPLVQIRGQWVQLDAEQIEAAINFWKKQTFEAEVTLQEAVQMGLSTQQTVKQLPVETVKYDGWLDNWMKQFKGEQKLSLIPIPTGLQATLRPYQHYGYAWLDFLQRWGMGACLADDMGLGKTLETITLILKQKESEAGLPGPVLVVCPTSVMVNWAKEVERFAPALSTHIHHGPSRLRNQDLIEQSHKIDMILSSYAIVRRDIETLQSINWFTVVLDEAQNIKNPEAQQTRAIQKLSAQFKLALTGTPVENRLSELWSIINFINPKFLGARQNFRKKFALPIERYHNEQATEQLKQMVGPFILRRVKTDPTVIDDLPEKQEMKVYCHLSQEQATLYQSIVTESMKKVDESSGFARKGVVLGMLMKLKQICNHPAQFLHQIEQNASDKGGNFRQQIARSGKLTRLLEMLEEIIAVGDRTLIFTQFSEMGFMLKTHLQHILDVPTQFLYGGTPAKKRAKMVEHFQESVNGPPIFILSLKAGGTGLNLTRANHVFHFDRWWNPAVENQATDRAFRIGQKQNVQVHKFVCTGTLEEKIDEMIESKKALAESVVGSGENWLTELSSNDLRDLITLRQEVLQ